MSRSESAPPVQLPAGVTVISIHPIYSVGGITLATLIGGPLGASWLMALNYKRFGEPRYARMAKALGVLATIAAIALWLTVRGGGVLWLVIVPVIAACLLALLLQSEAYDQHVAVGGSRGSSRRAAGVGALSLVVYVAAILGTCAVRYVATLPDRVMFWGNSVFYADGVSRNEAERVGKEIVAREPGSETSRWGVELRRDGNRPVIAFVVADKSAWSDQQIQRNLHELAEPLSRAVYGGAPVDIWLIDAPAFRPRVKLSWESRPR